MTTPQRQKTDDSDDLAFAAWQCSCESLAPSSPNTEAPSTPSSLSWEEIPTPASDSINGSPSANRSSASSSSWEDIASPSHGDTEPVTSEVNGRRGSDSAGGSRSGEEDSDYLCGRACNHEAHTGLRCPEKILNQEGMKEGDSAEYMCGGLVCKHKGITGIQCPKLAQIARNEEEVLRRHEGNAELGPADRKYIEASLELASLKAKLSTSKGPGDTAEFEDSLGKYVEATLEYEELKDSLFSGKADKVELGPAARKEGRASSRFHREKLRLHSDRGTADDIEDTIDRFFEATLKYYRLIAKSSGAGDHSLMRKGDGSRCEVESKKEHAQAIPCHAEKQSREVRDLAKYLRSFADKFVDDAKTRLDVVIGACNLERIAGYMEKMGDSTQAEKEKGRADKTAGHSYLDSKTLDGEHGDPKGSKGEKEQTGKAIMREEVAEQSSRTEATSTSHEVTVIARSSQNGDASSIASEDSEAMTISILDEVAQTLRKLRDDVAQQLQELEQQRGAVGDHVAHPEPMTIEEIARRHDQMVDDLAQQRQRLQQIADDADYLADDIDDLADVVFGDEIADPNPWTLQLQPIGIADIVAFLLLLFVYILTITYHVELLGRRE